MPALLRWSLRSTSNDTDSSRASTVVDEKGQAGLPSPTSSAATSATHLPEDTTKTLPELAADRKTVIDFDAPPSPRPLTTARILFAHIGEDSYDAISWYPSAALTLFLATTDSTIVSTCLPTIIRTFNGSESEYTWVAVAYLLTQTACQPLYGRISDLVGRKRVLFLSIFIFALGSLLCGAARDLKWLIAARALAGVGGGGIVCSVWVITSEIVDVRSRAKWSQALSVTWSCSAIAGPLLGGVFSFYLNLPICFVGALVLGFSLHDIRLSVPEDATWRSFVRKFDFIGLLLFIGGTSCIIVGFSFASSSGWTATSTLTLIIAGFLLLISAAIYELWTTRDALFPRAVFTNFNIIILLIVGLLHNVAFNSGTFYLALYYQTVGGSAAPLRSGLMLLPYSLGSSLASMPVAWLLGAAQKRTHNTVGQKWVISAGLLISAMGFTLIHLLREDTPTMMQSFLPLVAGFGLGMLFHAPYQSFTNALPAKELATGTSAFFLVRFTGATVGLSIAGAIYQGSVSQNVPPGASSALSSSSTEILQVPIAVSAIRNIWTMCAPCLGIALLFSLFLRPTSLPEPASSTSPCAAKTDAEHLGAL
ncbi:amino acid permease ScVBA-like protein [Gloeopeniophorella convolvens]|nr:amino acid permease ScVBA-like protein [Gloeopeniophorella convolvens]